MKFCLNVEDRYQKNSYRLQLDGSWQLCYNPAKLHSNDFTSSDRHILLRLQSKNEIIFNKTTHKVNEVGLCCPYVEQLRYRIYCFRDSYPSPPTLNQLEKVLLSGDDSKLNMLVLKVDGNFTLIDATLTSKKVDPFIVCRYEIFKRGNGYVGSTIRDEHFDDYIKKYFINGIESWKKHLVKHTIQQPCHDFEDYTHERLSAIYDELEQIKNIYCKK